MSYELDFSDSTNNSPLIVNDNSINGQTSLGFPGKNTVGYSKILGENFLHLLENFAKSSAPNNPIEGQLWYDTTANNTQLRIYDGTDWVPAGSVNKSTTPPRIGSIGDLWIDTLHQQLYLYSGVNWILVGPTFSSGLKSGVQVEQVEDSFGVDKTILKTYLNDQVISIYSSQKFIPKKAIDGFDTIYQGANVSSSNNNKVWGISEKAEALYINNTSVPAANFLRSDAVSTTAYPINIKVDGGLSIGSESQLKLQVLSSIGTLYHSTSQSALDLQINKSGVATTVLRIDSATGFVGINKLNPQSNLDVVGTSAFSGDMHVTSVTNSITSNTGALVIDGGMSVKKSAIFGADITVGGTIRLNYAVGLSSNSGSYPALVPATSGNINLGGNDSGNALYPFANVYSNNFIATNNGNFIGNLTGSITGNSTSASRLLASTTFDMDGDVSASGFSFDGLTGGITYTVDNTVGINGFISKSGSGPFVVTLAIPLQTIAPVTGINYVITGNLSALYNGSFYASGSTLNSITLLYTVDPGTYGLGTTIIASSQGLTKTFHTTISSDFITTKTEVTDTSESDVLLIYRQGVGLRKTSKPNFVKSLALVPVGSIFPFAGPAANIPDGYLLCDGSEQEKTKFLDLFNVIGYTYGNPVTLIGRNSFKIPDLRGRFPLGLDNMDNNTSVNVGASYEKTITTPAGRILDISGINLGNASGHETATLDISNVPPHKHKLQGDQHTQFYAVNNVQGEIPTDSGSSNTYGTQGAGERIDRTGDILYGSPVAAAFNIMNPYMSINYIIYAGKVYSI
jgi:microcystin-dependent protein